MPCEFELITEAVGFKGDETKELVIGVDWERPGTCLKGGNEEGGGEVGIWWSDGDDSK